MQRRSEEDRQQVSLVVAVRDDPDGLSALLGALAQQSEMPDEIVVVDGGSHDGTLAALDAWNPEWAPLRVVVAPGSNIAAGRNIAVKTAQYDWIVSTDAGCRPIPGWLAALKSASAHADIAAGTFAIDGDSAFKRAVAYAHYPAIGEIDDRRALVRVSHRLFGRAFRAHQTGGGSMGFSRAVWQAVGGFPEHLYTSEDWLFASSAVEHGFEAVLVKDALVYWGARETWKDTARMFQVYARGDIRSPGRSRHLIRTTAWTAGSAVILRGGRRGQLVVLAGAFAYVALPFYRAHRDRFAIAEWWRIPALVAVKDLAQITGAFQGTLDHLRGVHQPDPKPRRS